MIVAELITLHNISDVERTPVLFIFAMSVENPEFASFLLKQNRGIFYTLRAPPPGPSSTSLSYLKPQDSFAFDPDTYQYDVLSLEPNKKILSNFLNLDQPKVLKVQTKVQELVHKTNSNASGNACCL